MFYFQNLCVKSKLSHSNCVNDQVAVTIFTKGGREN